MPRVSELFEKFDPITADFTSIRWLGDRKASESLTDMWDKTIVDRKKDLQEWVKYTYQIQKRGVTVFGCANNHYAGHAPAAIELFEKLYENGK